VGRREDVSIIIIARDLMFNSKGIKNVGLHPDRRIESSTQALKPVNVDASRPCKGTLTLSDFLAAEPQLEGTLRRGRRGVKGRPERSVKGDLEGGRRENFITTCDFS